MSSIPFTKIESLTGKKRRTWREVRGEMGRRGRSNHSRGGSWIHRWRLSRRVDSRCKLRTVEKPAPKYPFFAVRRRYKTLVFLRWIKSPPWSGECGFNHPYSLNARRSGSNRSESKIFGSVRLIFTGLNHRLLIWSRNFQKAQSAIQFSVQLAHDPYVAWSMIWQPIYSLL